MLLKCSVMALKTPTARTKWATDAAGCRSSVCVGAAGTRCCGDGVGSLEKDGGIGVTGPDHSWAFL